MTETTLGELLTDNQIHRVSELFITGDKEGVKLYLRSLEPQLKERGVIPDFLYYQLELYFNKRQNQKQ